MLSVPVSNLAGELEFAWVFLAFNFAMRQSNAVGKKNNIKGTLSLSPTTELTLGK